MLFNPKQEDRFDLLAGELCVAQSLTPELIARTIAQLCVRIPALRNSGRTSRINRLVDAGAMIEAALAIVELELPEWKLRRLVCDDGEWSCSLSRNLNLPPAIDEQADASHASPALAILSAFVEARRMSDVTRPKVWRTVPETQIRTDQRVCCDNFA